MLVLPRTSISTASLAFISSSARCTCLRIASGDGAGSGILVLMTWAWVVNVVLDGERRAGLYAPGGLLAPIKPLSGDVGLHLRVEPAAVALPGPQASSQLGGRGRVQGHVQTEQAAGRGLGQRGRCFGPAAGAGVGQVRREGLEVMPGAH